jgi:hypothetical protein
VTMRVNSPLQRHAVRLRGHHRAMRHFPRASSVSVVRRILHKVPHDGGAGTAAGRLCARGAPRGARIRDWGRRARERAARCGVARPDRYRRCVRPGGGCWSTTAWQGRSVPSWPRRCAQWSCNGLVPTVDGRRVVVRGSRELRGRPNSPLSVAMGSAVRGLGSLLRRACQACVAKDLSPPAQVFAPLGSTSQS